MPFKGKYDEGILTLAQQGYDVFGEDPDPGTGGTTVPSGDPGGDAPSVTSSLAPTIEPEATDTPTPPEPEATATPTPTPTPAPTATPTPAPTATPEPIPDPTVYYAVLFETNGGSRVSAAVYPSGTRVDLSSYETTREGYTFTGWYQDKALTRKITAVYLDNTKTVYAGWEKTETDTRQEQEISMSNPLQERDLKNGSRNTMSKACTLKLGFTVDDSDRILSYATSDPSVATVEDGKITYQGIGECVITVTAAATDLCKEAVLEISVKVGSLGTPTFTPSVTSRTAPKAFVATSSTVRGVDGWEVQYSIREDFWKPVTRDFPETGTKLYRETCTTMQSNRTYYIHVRGYQIIDGEKVYSDWSPVKTIKTK